MRRFEQIIDAYRSSFKVHGRSAAAVLCPKGRQDLRFQNLVDEIDCEPFSVLDYGCGLAHLFEHLAQRFQRFDYHGVDMVPEFVSENRKNAAANASFDCVPPDAPIGKSYDYVFASGVFNLSFVDDALENRALVFDRVEALFRSARVALVCDFMTTFVDYQQPGAFHVSPSAVLEFVNTKLTRRFKLRQDYMPYEFAVVLHRDDEILRPQNVFPQRSMRSGEAA